MVPNFESNDILCGIVYIPPENSEYASKCPYNEIESEMQSFAEKFSSIIMFRDFNSRTKCLSDYIEIDEHIFVPQTQKTC